MRPRHRSGSRTIRRRRCRRCEILIGAGWAGWRPDAAGSESTLVGCAEILCPCYDKSWALARRCPGNGRAHRQGVSFLSLAARCWDGPWHPCTRIELRGALPSGGACSFRSCWDGPGLVTSGPSVPAHCLRPLGRSHCQGCAPVPLTPRRSATAGLRGPVVFACGTSGAWVCRARLVAGRDGNSATRPGRPSFNPHK